eukprot:Skav208555  [mRNA]  locus=scaffold1216:676220:677759:+ [translate_table: standard]
MHKRHNHCDAVRFLYQGTQCPHCLKEYFAHTKLQLHLKHVRRCREALRGRGPLTHPAPGFGSRIDLDLRKVHDGLAPVTQAQGPFQDQTRAPIVIDDQLHYGLQSALLECIVTTWEEDTWDSLDLTLRTAICALPVTWTQCRYTLLALCDGWTQEDRDLLQDRLDFVNRHLRLLSVSDSWPFLRGSQSSAPPKHALWYLEERFAHLQSGGGDSYRAPREAVHRPVGRLRDAPWGCSSLRLKEVAQLHMGNTLLGFGYVMFCELGCRRRLALLEHPQEPEDPEHVSIWCLPITQALLALPGVTTMTLAQGLFGSESAKPTQFLLAQMTDLWQDLSACRLSHELPKTISVGRNEFGTFKTSKLKEYAPAFCLSMARCIVRNLQKQSMDDDLQFDPGVIDRCKGMVVETFSDNIGRDFCR